MFSDPKPKHFINFTSLFSCANEGRKSDTGHKVREAIRMLVDCRDRMRVLVNAVSV
jgi:hypothetical protein